MGFDNRIFNVNGETEEQLKKTLELAFAINSDNTKAVSWKFVPDVGLIFFWTHRDDKGFHKFPISLTGEKVASMAWEWLSSEEANAMPFKDWDDDSDHDGSNGRGWRVFVNDWGHVGEFYEAICAVRPVYVWFGK